MGSGMLLEDYLPLLLGPQVPHGVEHSCCGQMHHTLLRTDLVRKQSTSALLKKEKKRISRSPRQGHASRIKRQQWKLCPDTGKD